MGRDHGAGQPFYWSLDIPGMTADQAPQVVAAVKGGGLPLDPLLVDPAIFLTLHLDRESVEAIVTALTESPSNAVGDGLRESLGDWLAWLDDDE